MQGIISGTGDFIGWCLEKDETEFTGPITEDIVLYPKWEDNIIKYEETTTLIHDEADLKAWAAAVNGTAEEESKSSINAILFNNIELNKPSGEASSNWTPIASYSGTFDGNGHTISNLNIYDTTGNYIGFFGRLSGIVKNLSIEGEIEISTANKLTYIGGIIGLNKGKIVSCTAKINKMLEQNQGTIYIGNIAGENSNGKIIGCYSIGSNVDVLSKTMDAVDSGGIVDNNSGLSASIVACYAIKGQIKVTAETDVQSKCYVGGIAGNNSASISACYAASNTFEVSGENIQYKGTVTENSIIEWGKAEITDTDMLLKVKLKEGNRKSNIDIYILDEQGKKYNYNQIENSIYVYNNIVYANFNIRKEDFPSTMIAVISIDNEKIYMELEKEQT